MWPGKSDKMKYRYHLDNIDEQYISGWVKDLESPAPCKVEFRTTDMELVASGMADLVREDQDGVQCGFKFQFGPQFIDRLPIRLLIYANGIKVANYHVVVAMRTHILNQVLEDRVNALVGIRTERLEREIEMLRDQLLALRRETQGATHVR